MFVNLKKTKRFLKHFFLPQESNNYQAKYLQHDFLTGLIIALLFINLSFRLVIGKTNNNILGVSINLSVADLLEETNSERVKRGLNPLTLSPTLSQAAKDKGEDMFANNYWAHFSPTGVSPWYFMEKNNYNYTYAGENLAKDFTKSNDIINAWLNSPKHRENLLKPEYQEVGFSISEGVLQGQPTVLVVQMFGSTGSKNQEKIVAAVKSNTAPPSNKQPNVQIAGLANTSIQKKPLIDLMSLKKQLVFLILSGLIAAFAIDMYFSNKKTNLIFSKRNFAHLFLVIVFIVSIMAVKPGLIL